MFRTVGEIIDKLGGPTVVTSALGETNKSVVGSWSHRNSIPGDRWLALTDLARNRGVDGITVETLAALHSKDVEARP